MYSQIQPELVQNMKRASTEYRHSLSVKRQTKDNVKEALNVTMKPIQKRAAIDQIGNIAKKEKRREDHAATTCKCADK